MRPAAVLLLPLLAAGCEWIYESEVSDRFDDDDDGYPVWSDCNDERQDVTFLQSRIELYCGDIIEAEVAGRNLLHVSTCPHPTTPDTLLGYGRNEDIRVLRSEVAASAVITLTTHDDFSQTDWRLDEDESVLETGGVALFAWEGPVCDEAACNVGLPLGTQAQVDGEGGWVSRVEAQLEPSEPWFVVVTGDPDSSYTLTVDCW